MKKNLFIAGVMGCLLAVGAVHGHAATWVKTDFDVPNKNLEANFYDSESVKSHDKTLSWTEKYVLTSFGSEQYTKHLSQYPACRQNIEKKGPVTHHQIDFEIKEGKYRLVAKRNYNKENELVCTDKEMGKELNTSWSKIKKASPMDARYYEFVTKFKIGNI